MNPPKLTHLIYTSAAAPGLDASDLRTILQAARTKNAELSITGMLLHTSGSFFQVLEGDESTLLKLYSTISSDPRHLKVTKIIHEPIAKRAFGDWTMGFSDIDESELETITGFSDFFQNGNSLANLLSGRAKKLVSAFAEGRWRTRLDGGIK
jgi:hypothetical protein